MRAPHVRRPIPDFAGVRARTTQEPKPLATHLLAPREGRRGGRLSRVVSLALVVSVVVVACSCRGHGALEGATASSGGPRAVPASTLLGAEDTRLLSQGQSPPLARVDYSRFPTDADPSSPQGHTYYVSPGGNDAAPAPRGNPSAPSSRRSYLPATGTRSSCGPGPTARLASWSPSQTSFWQATAMRP